MKIDTILADTLNKKYLEKGTDDYHSFLYSVFDDSSLFIKIMDNKDSYDWLCNQFDPIDLMFSHIRGKFQRDSFFINAMIQRNKHQFLIDIGFFDNGLNFVVRLDDGALNLINNLIVENSEYFNFDYLKDNIVYLKILKLMDFFIKNYLNRIVDKEEIFELINCCDDVEKLVGSFSDNQLCIIIESIDVNQYSNLIPFFLKRVPSMFDSGNFDIQQKIGIIKKISDDFTSDYLELDNELLKIIKIINYDEVLKINYSGINGDVQGLIRKKNKEFIVNSIKNGIDLKDELNYIDIEDSVDITKEQWVEFIINSEDIWFYYIKDAIPQSFINYIFSNIKDKLNKDIAISFLDIFDVELNILIKFEYFGKNLIKYTDTELVELYKLGKISKKELIDQDNEIDFVANDIPLDESDIIKRIKINLDSVMGVINQITIKSIKKELKKKSLDYREYKNLEMALYVHPENSISEKLLMIPVFDFCNAYDLIAFAKSKEEFSYYYEKFIDKPLKESIRILKELLKNNEFLNEDQVTNVVNRILKQKDGNDILMQYEHLLNDKIKSKMFTSSIKNPDIALALLKESSVNDKDRKRCINSIFKSEKHLIKFLEIVQEDEKEFLIDQLISNEIDRVLVQSFSLSTFGDLHRKKILNYLVNSDCYFVNNISSTLTINDLMYLNTIQNKNAMVLIDYCIAYNDREKNELFHEIKNCNDKISLYAKALSEDLTEKDLIGFEINQVEFEY